MLPHVGDAHERDDRVQLVVVPAGGFVRSNGTRAPILRDAGGLPQLPQTFLRARVPLPAQLPHARRRLKRARQGAVVPPASARGLRPLLEGGPPRIGLVHEVCHRQWDQRALLPRLLGGLGARGVQATQQPVHGQGIRSHERRGHETLGQFAALGRVRVAVPRRKSHEVEEEARRGL